MLHTRTRRAVAIALIAITTLGAGIAIGWRIGIANKPRVCPTFKGATPISSWDTGTKKACTFARAYGRATFSVEL
jgi:hypothetical protein